MTTGLGGLPLGPQMAEACDSLKPLRCRQFTNCPASGTRRDFVKVIEHWVPGVEVDHAHLLESGSSLSLSESQVLETFLLVTQVLHLQFFVPRALCFS